MSILKGIKINSTTAREFLFFLLLTTLVATIIKLSKSYASKYEVAINVIDLPLNKTVNKITPETIIVNTTHTGFSLLRNSVSTPQLAIPFSSMQKTSNGTYEFLTKDNLSSLKNSLRGKVDVTSVNPSQVRVTIDSMATKRVPIKLHLNVAYAPGYGKSEETKITPDSVTIVGPTALLNSLDEVQTKELILEDVSSSIEESIGFKAPDTTKLIKFDIDKVSIVQEVSRFTEGSVVVPIQIENNIGGKVKILPKTAQIIYSVKIDNFDKVSASDFLVTCKFDNNATTDSYLPLSIKRIPSYISSARLSDKQVQFIVVN